MFQWLKGMWTKAHSQGGLKAPQKETIFAPMTGTLLSIREVPDATFAQKLVGDGCALLPTSPYVVSPAAGRLVKLFKTRHAFAMKLPSELELLVHIGIDTVKLGGKGFKALVEEGAQLEVNDPILELDLPYLTRNTPSLISPIVVSNLERVEKLSCCLQSGAVVTAGVTPILTLSLF